MPFHKVTYNEKYSFATVHNYGCTFRCPVCSYKLKSGAEGMPGLAFPRPERFLKVDEIKNALKSRNPRRVYFMGGEPSIDPALPELLDFAKNTLKAETRLGHTNGSNLDLPFLDSANVGLKAWNEDVHLAYTGREKSLIFGNFERAFRCGMELKANIVFVPGLVDIDQVEAVAHWLSGLSVDIPFHVMAYIPVPGQDFRRPAAGEVAECVEVCEKYLTHVEASHLSPDEARDLSGRDDRFKVEKIA